MPKRRRLLILVTLMACVAPSVMITPGGAVAAPAEVQVKPPAKQANAAKANAAEALSASDLRLLHQVEAEQDQLLSFAVIPEAQAFLGQAKAAEAVAQKRLDWAVSIWQGDRLMQDKARAAELVTSGLVNFYQEALGQLGLAEYTGSSMASGNVGSQETVLDDAELANVAAGVATRQLHLQRSELLSESARARHWGQAVAGAQATLAVAQQALKRADAQLTLSSHDVLVAQRWATGEGVAPSVPVAALVRLEGPLGRRPRARQEAMALVDLSSTTTSTTTTTSGAVPSTTTPPSGTATVPTGAVAGPMTRHEPLPETTSTSTTTVPVALTASFLAGQGPRILGPSLLTASEVEGWFASTDYRARATVALGQLVDDYMTAGQATGVRPDLAFAQSVVETGYFSFPPGGQLTPKDNNFAGIGACDRCKHGWKFPSAAAGVTAQLQLLESYATPLGAGNGASPLADPGVEGCCATWLGLSGVWASNPNYGYEILGIYEEMLAWAIPRSLMANGLASPTDLAGEALSQAAVGASSISPDVLGTEDQVLPNGGNGGPPVPPALTSTTSSTVPAGTEPSTAQSAVQAHLVATVPVLATALVTAISAAAVGTTWVLSRVMPPTHVLGAPGHKGST